MRNSFGTRVSLLIVTVLGSQYLPGQTSYPIQGQPQGGDRRGSYYYDDPEAQKAYDEGRGIPRLYPDPKLYLHNMTLLAHVPRGGGDMMTIGGNRYLVGGGVIIDVTAVRLTPDPRAAIDCRAESCCVFCLAAI